MHGPDKPLPLLVVSVSESSTHAGITDAHDMQYELRSIDLSAAVTLLPLIGAT